jgi:hypothetical protein
MCVCVLCAFEGGGGCPLVYGYPTTGVDVECERKAAVGGDFRAPW